jgi:hypothetical protein
VKSTQDWIRPLRKASDIGTFDYKKFSTDLIDAGFELVGSKRITERPLSGVYEEYRLAPCSFFRMTWYLSQSGTGNAWEAWWNFRELEQVLDNEIEPVVISYRNAQKKNSRDFKKFCRRKKIDPYDKTGFFKHRFDPDCPKFDLTPELDKLNKVDGKYRDLRNLLTQTPNVITNPVFVWIPGIEAIPKGHAGLIMRLLKYLGTPLYAGARTIQRGLEGQGRPPISPKVRQKRKAYRKQCLKAAREARKVEREYSAGDFDNLEYENKLDNIAKARGVNPDALWRFAEGKRKPAEWADYMTAKEKGG